MENEIFKDAPRTKMITTRLTKAEYKICKKACKERKLNLAQLVRYSLDLVLKDVEFSLVKIKKNENPG